MAYKIINGKATWQGAKPKPRAAAKPKPKPRPVNPLDAEVNAAIGSQVKPLQGMLNERNLQYGAEAQLGTNADAALQSELQGLGSQYNTSKSQAIGAVGAGQAASQSEQQRGNDFLQSVLGGWMSDPQSAQAALKSGQLKAGAAGDLQNRTVAGQLALEQQAGNQSLATQGSAAAMQARAFQNDALTRKSADARTIQTQIAAIKAGAPSLRRQFATENEQLKLARDQLNQNQSQFDSTLSANTEQAALDRTAAAEAAKLEAGAKSTLDPAKSAANVDAARSKAAGIVDNLSTAIAASIGDPAQFAQLATRLPGLNISANVTGKDGSTVKVLDPKKWKKLTHSPGGVDQLYQAFKTQGLAPVWAFWAAAKIVPAAYWPAGRTFDIKTGHWRDWTAAEKKQLAKGWKPIHYRYL